MMCFCHIDGKDNPADILSKHWGHSKVWPQLKQLLFMATIGGDVPVPERMKGSNKNSPYRHMTDDGKTVIRTEDRTGGKNEESGVTGAETIEEKSRNKESNSPTTKETKEKVG